MSGPSRHRIRLRHASSLALRATLRDGLRMTKPDPVLNTNSQTFLDHSSGIILKGVKRKSGRDTSLHFAKKSRIKTLYPPGRG